MRREPARLGWKYATVPRDVPTHAAELMDRIQSGPIRTGWHVIGRTIFQNFDPDETPPTAFAPGDTVEFTVAM